MAEQRKPLSSFKKPIASFLLKETNVPSDKLNDLKKYRDFEPTAEMTPTQQLVGGMQKDKYRNIESEPNLLTKFAKGVSNVAPTVGSTVAGTIGRVLGRGPGAVASGAGYGVGLALGESVENIAGIQDETPEQLAKEAVAEPIAVGAADYAIDYGASKAGQGLKTLGQKAKGLLPKQPDIFKSIFTVPRKIASRMDLDGMSKKMTDYGVKGGLDDFEKVSSKITGKDGVLSKATRDALGKVGGQINTESAFEAAQQGAENALNLDDKVINKTLRKVTNIISKSHGDVPGKTSAIDLWDSVQALEKEGYNLMSKSTDMTPRIDMEQQANIFLYAADALKDQIDNAVVGEGIINSVKDKYIKELTNINPKLAEEFLSVKNIRDIRSLARPFVDLSNATRMTKDAGSSVFEKVLMGQKTGLESVDITKPLTVLNPVLQRPGAKSWISTMGVPKVPEFIKPFVKTGQVGAVAGSTEVISR